jgi:hypothetical protein
LPVPFAHPLLQTQPLFLTQTLPMAFPSGLAVQLTKPVAFGDAVAVKIPASFAIGVPQRLKYRMSSLWIDLRTNQIPTVDCREGSIDCFPAHSCLIWEGCFHDCVRNPGEAPQMRQIVRRD